MSLEHIAVLAFIQGVTEFIPVSSSGHLVLGHLWLETDTQNAPQDAAIIIDVALHLGTLLAVMVYFRADVKRLLSGLFQLLTRQNASDGATDGPTDGDENSDIKAARQMIWATLPVLCAAALLMASDLVSVLRQPHIVAWASILFAMPLYAADRYGKASKTLDMMSDKNALVMGLAQMLALIPGASRAGVTMTAGRALGFSREAAARYSMLMAMPVIVCFALVGLLDLINSGDWQALGAAIFGAALAAVFAFISIDVFLRLTRKLSLLPFVLYRIGLGVAILSFL